MTPTFTPAPVWPKACQPGALCACTPWLTTLPRSRLGGMIARTRTTPGRAEAAASNGTGT